MLNAESISSSSGQLAANASSKGLGASPDIRQDPGFERLQNEVAKMSNPSASGAVDWTSIDQLTESLLTRDYSPDLLVVCYRVAALLKTRGLGGLLDGLQGLRNTLEAQWETLTPPLARLRGRRNALQWLVDRIKLCADHDGWPTLAAQQGTLVDGLRLALQEIDGLLAERDEQAPSFRVLITLVKAIPVEMAVPEHAAGDVHCDGAGEQEIASGVQDVRPSAASALLDEPEDGERALVVALARLDEIADGLLDVSLENPLAYRLKRVAAWAMLEAPLVRHERQTYLPAPLAALDDALHALTQRQADADLIRFTQAQLSRYPFWLDLNYVAVLAMERLGAPFDGPRKEIIGETARLFDRLPELEALTFASGKPFADTSTRQWLGALRATRAAAARAQGVASQGVPTGAQSANASHGGLKNGAAAMTCAPEAVHENAAAPGEKFRQRLDFCERLLAQRSEIDVRAIARVILADIDRYTLTEWDPPLALSGLMAAYKAFSAHDERGEAGQLLTRIAALDMQVAVDLLSGQRNR
jgi:type VI secretion system protein VasJ